MVFPMVVLFGAFFFFFKFLFSSFRGVFTLFFIYFFLINLFTLFFLFFFFNKPETILQVKSERGECLKINGKLVSSKNRGTCYFKSFCM